jgi:hypothetical protein
MRPQVIEGLICPVCRWVISHGPEIAQRQPAAGEPTPAPAPCPRCGTDLNLTPPVQSPLTVFPGENAGFLRREAVQNVTLPCGYVAALAPSEMVEAMQALATWPEYREWLGLSAEYEGNKQALNSGRTQTQTWQDKLIGRIKVLRVELYEKEQAVFARFHSWYAQLKLRKNTITEKG